MLKKNKDLTPAPWPHFDNKGNYTSELKCPYCGHEYEDDCKTDSEQAILCITCFKKFKFTKHVTIEYRSHASCELNNDLHDFTIVKMDKYIIKICKNCDYFEKDKR